MRKKVIIVDDEKEICFLLSSFLKSKGYKTSTAYNLKSAEELIVAEKPEFIILDVNLPDGEGFDIVPTIKKYTEAKIIIITARDGNREVKLAKQLDVDSFFRKPFNRNKILETLESLH